MPTRKGERRASLAADGRQFTLDDRAPGRGAHSNLGKTLESMVERQNAAYLCQGLAKIEHLPNAWRFSNPNEARRLAPAIRALTGLGRWIVRAQSPWDFSGHYRGMPLAFDCKEFAEASIPLSNFKPHQARHLADFERSGGVGGFLVYSRRLEKLWWLDARPALRLLEELRVGREGHKKSLSLAWLDEHALGLGTAAPWQGIDYAAALYSERWPRREHATRTP
jgi:recombination protein U